MSSENGTPTDTVEPDSDRSRRLPTLPSSSSSQFDGVASLRPPPLPYVPGACFDIKPNSPPPPYDGGYGYYKPDPREWNGYPWPRGQGAPNTIVEQFLAHPPRKTIPHPDQTARCLKIIQQIRCGDPCKAQVVRCLMDGRELVAKIFDPLYVGLDGDDFPPTYFSERFYSCEAAAYNKISEDSLDSRFTPKFEGCWSLELPLRDAKGHVIRREVHLILQQFIPSTTMQGLLEQGEAKKIDPRVRMDLVGQVMEFYSQLFFIGVINDDVHPRNLIIDKGANNEWNITLVDFSHSRVKDLPNSMWRTCRGDDERLLESPMTLWWGDWPPGCSEWVPKKYNGHTEESFEMSLKWMKDRWEGAKQYKPVKYEWLRGSLIDDYIEDDTAEDDIDQDDST